MVSRPEARTKAVLDLVHWWEKNPRVPPHSIDWDAARSGMREAKVVRNRDGVATAADGSEDEGTLDRESLFREAKLKEWHTIFHEDKALRRLSKAEAELVLGAYLDDTLVGLPRR